MLETPVQEFDRLIAELGCQVRLPPDTDHGLATPGAKPICYGDLRRYRRFRFQTVALAQCHAPLPNCPRPDRPFVVYTVDVSRSGLGLLHAEQLFPQELWTLHFADGGCRTIKVLRCRRICEQCYEIGGVFI